MIWACIKWDWIEYALIGSLVGKAKTNQQPTMTGGVKVMLSCNLTQRERRRSSVVGVIAFVKSSSNREMTRRMKKEVNWSCCWCHPLSVLKGCEGSFVAQMNSNRRQTDEGTLIERKITLLEFSTQKRHKSLERQCKNVKNDRNNKTLRDFNFESLILESTIDAWLDKTARQYWK